MRSKLLWVLQGLLCALFLFAGGAKLAMPIAALEKQSHMSGLFLRFIAVCEILGALGLILPGLLKIRQELTPIAAAGLVIIMIGAVVTSIMQGMAATAIFPGVVGLLCAYIAYARWRQPSSS
ncbi:MAG TPA: DoxX family protein [Thermoanaerobaculia bacterium]|nr:DoxX family protein [Thermoanaerobaculia bacterium]